MYHPYDVHGLTFQVGYPLSRLERILQIAVVVAALATVPLVISAERNPGDPLVLAGDWAVWSVFVVEYVWMMYLA